MVTEYLDFDHLKKDYPTAVQLIINENKIQCPNAKFIRATVGLDARYEDNNDYDLHLMALFDLGTPEMSLWVWVPGVSDPYIDEYYEVLNEDANRYLSSLREKCDHNWVMDGHNAGDPICSKCFKRE